jgi:uncharacterized lipoprotein YddW (UPF0748 family)
MHPQFQEQLVAASRARSSVAEGLYADPTSVSYRDHLVAVVSDLMERYPLQGLHLDYVRYPAATYGYTKNALDRFRVEVDREITAADRADMATRVLKDPLVYTRRYPIRWSEFRRHGVSETVRALVHAARMRRPGIEVSAAVIPEIARARDELFQDWTRWMDENALDAVCPMNYSGSGASEEFRSRCEAAVAAKRRCRVYMGIAAYKLKVEEAISRADIALNKGCDGVVYFSHASLRESPGSFRKIAEPRQTGTLAQ